jgi:hypothetical protein
MSAKDQILSAEIHGEALLAAKRPELQTVDLVCSYRLHAGVLPGGSRAGYTVDQ